MKKIILTFVLIANILNAQKIETIKSDVVVGKLNHISLNISNDKFVLCFTNVEFTTINDTKCISIGTKEFTDELYKKLSENFIKQVPENLQVQLGNQKLKFYFVTALGVKSFRFELKDELGIVSISEYVTKKKLDKLFGYSK